MCSLDGCDGGLAENAAGIFLQRLMQICDTDSTRQAGFKPAGLVSLRSAAMLNAQSLRPVDAASSDRRMLQTEGNARFNTVCAFPNLPFRDPANGITL
jgi:hypothetical protein